MHKSDNIANNNKDTGKMQYFAANAWLLMLVFTFSLLWKGLYVIGFDFESVPIY